ncbi:MAG: ATP-binding protein [Chloroherpetonaceae bacterium]|nr:ATP-binding protein [Chloroherpetonaceae bacterium]
MPLRLIIIIYLVVIHIAFGGTAYWLLAENRVWMLAVEGFIALSLSATVAIFYRLQAPITLLKNGADLLRESDFSSTLRPIGQSEYDAIIEVYNTMITRLRDERLRTNEQAALLSKLIHASPAAIILYDFDYRLLLLNPKAKTLFQISDNYYKGKTLESLVQEALQDFCKQLTRLKIGSPEILALSGNRKYKVTKSEFIDQGFRRAFIQIEEITKELRQFEKQAYEKVIRMLSHEVNNTTGATRSLLHSCLNYSPQLGEDDRNDFEKALRVAISRLNALSSFMESYASIVRLPPPQMQPVNLADLIGSVCKLFHETAENAGVAMGLEFEKGSLTINGDRAQLEQVFINVMKNAIEAASVPLQKNEIETMSGAFVLIRVFGEKNESNSKSIVTIEDNGEGFPKGVEENLFTPFFSTKEKGQGLGLMLVQEILTAHGAVFSLSRSNHRTTIFRIEF